MIYKKVNSFSLQPGEILPEAVQIELQEANKLRSKDFPAYKKKLRKIFGIQEDQLPACTSSLKIFLAGFIAGEGSINVSAKKSSTSKFGLIIDPEFSITQHANGFQHLYCALCIFNTGSISYKSGSNATLVFRIDNRRSLEEKVIPFWEKYMDPYLADEARKRKQLFKQLLELFNSEAHLDLDSFANEILPLWDQMRKQKNQSNQTFADLTQAQVYIRNYKK